MILNGLFHSSVHVISARVLSVDDIHWESSVGDVEYRSLTKETGEFRRVHSITLYQSSLHNMYYKQNTYRYIGYIQGHTYIDITYKHVHYLRSSGGYLRSNKVFIFFISNRSAV